MIPKFRVWIKERKEMIYLAETLSDDTYMQINNRSWGIFNGSDETAIANKHFGDVLMQCTGLLDKNKSELYDKDIVNVWDKDFRIYIRHAVLTWDKTGRWMFDFGDKEPYFAHELFRDLSGEGIDDVFSDMVGKVGNIFETPDLLTDGLRKKYNITE